MELEEQRFILQRDQIALMPLVAQAYASAHPDSPPLSQIASASGTPMGQSSITFPAQIHAPTATLRSPLSSTITEILVKPGQQVKKGEILFKLDNRDAQQRVEIDKARLQLAQEHLKRAKAFDAVAQANQDHTTPEEAQTEVDVEAALLKSDETALDGSNIRAPFDGTLTTFDLAPGLFVAQGGALTELVNTADLNTVFRVAPPADVKLGEKIGFRLEFKGREFPGEVTYVSPTIDSTTGTYEVSAHLTGDTAGLRPGTFGNVALKN